MGNIIIGIVLCIFDQGHWALDANTKARANFLVQALVETGL